MAALKMYEELAKWWLLLSPPEEYTEEVAFFLEVLHEAGAVSHGTLLELGSGGGSNAFLLKEHFTLTLTDLSPDMLAVSRSINPECDHHVGDMRTLRLGQQFDVVFVHDAIDYMLTETDLRAAFATAFIHCKPGSIALFVPDHMRDTFKESDDYGGNDGEERGLRYMEWTFDPDPSDTTYTTHYVFMLREGHSVHVEHDEHTGGLFTRAEWLAWLQEAGFEVMSRIDPYDREVFVAIKP